MRMWLRERIREIDSQLVALVQVITSRAESEMYVSLTTTLPCLL